MSRSFWRAFWQGASPLYWLAWALFGTGHVVSALVCASRYCAWLYPLYRWLMEASCAVQERFGFSGPWRYLNPTKDDYT